MNADFTWQRARRSHFGRLQSFATDVFDQHAVAWCGCCYVVAVVQCIEDRGHIFLGHRVRIDMQTMLNHASLAYSRNACLGGRSTDVVRCIMEETCPMVTRCSRWLGRPMRTTNTPLSDVPFRITDVNTRVRSEDVKGLIRRDGPVILLINSQTLKNVDAAGVVNDLTFRAPNHAVTVVGWKNGAWIVRNSWGRRRVPAAVPDNLACVDGTGEECKVTWEHWVGDPLNPGFVYLPMAAAALHPPHTPWIVVTLRRK